CGSAPWGATGIPGDKRPRPGGRSCIAVLLQRLEPQAVRPGAINAEATLLVFLVLAVIALEELHVLLALEGKDVRGDAVQEPAVMRNDEGVAREHQHRVLKRP